MEIAQLVSAEPKMSTGRHKRGKDKLNKVAAKLIQKFVNKQQPSLWRQDKTDGHLKLFG